MINLLKKETQLEIFNIKENVSDKKQNNFSSLFQYLIKYEKFIFSGVAFIVTFLIAYSVGFEKGKSINLAAVKNTSQRTLNVIAKDALNQNKENKKAEATYVTVVKQTQTPKGPYVIQVASYIKESLAKKEMLALKNKGFNPLIANKGKFVVVYVGNFSDKLEAQSSLKKLKASYRDCFIIKRT